MGILTIDSVLKYYDNKIILSDVSFTVKQSQILGVFGRNGSGKTTLLNIILGLEKCDYIFRKYKNKKINNTHIPSFFSYSSQKIFIPNHLRISQLLKLFSIKDQELIKSDDLIVKSLALKFKELSYGQQFYVQLFCVIHSNKEICVLDELFASLAPLYRSQIVEYIKKTKNKIFIITDHHIDELFEICTKKMFLKHGKLINVDNKTLTEVKEMYQHVMF